VNGLPPFTTARLGPYGAVISLRPPPEPTQPRWRKGLVAAIAVLVVVGVAIWAALPAIEGLVHGSSSGHRGICFLPTLPAPATSYDEQLFLVESGNSTSLAFSVPAVAQSDSNGYGPAYLVNGLTPSGYWYQVGIAYDWPCGSGYVQGFHFISEVFAPGGRSVYGPTIIPMIIVPGDAVNLTLRFGDSNVWMTASDSARSSNESTVYSAEGASNFTGGLEAGWFTGVMTEWYHSQAYYGGELPVTYNATTPISGDGAHAVTLGIDEYAQSGGTLFYQTDPVEIGCPCSYPFAYEGAAVEVGPANFTSGA
jgi:hypothetical protein